MSQTVVYLWVAAGGALGTMGRYWLGDLVSRHFETFPMGTLVINVSGSFLIGFFATLTEPEGRFMVSPTARKFFMTGICGGYTTFSSFSLQTLDLARAGQWLYAGLNTFFSVFLCLLAVWLGFILARALNPMKGR